MSHPRANRLVGTTGFEPATSRSRTVRATICATPRKTSLNFEMVGKAGIEPAISRTPSERSTSEPLPETSSRSCDHIHIVSFFEQIFQRFFDFRQ